MDFGALMSGLVTGLREGVEAALIVAIIAAYLVKTGNGRHLGRIVLGATAAVIVSLVLGIVLIMTVGRFEEPYEQIFEGLTMLLAAGVVTWMLFWMRRQAASVRGELQEAVDRVLTTGALGGLVLLAFTAVIREGIETSLFLVGQVTAAGEGSPTAPLSILVGALIGLVIAAVLGYGIYRGSRALDIRRFFRWTGIALIFIAAGLLSNAVHEFIEIGAITFGTATAFDLSGVLPHDEDSGNLLGQFLRAMFGYTATPEWTTLVVHITYLVTVLYLYLRPVAPPAPRRRDVEATART